MSKDLEFLIQLVSDANDLITDDFQINSKGDDGDLVTNFDFEIENFIINRIKKDYPNFEIVSEEYNSDKCLTDNCFTIDPIDGTINFANNIPLWGIQVACIKNGKTCAAVIYLPKLDEMYYADETGSYLNGNIISVNNLNSNNGIYTVDGPNRLPGQIKMRTISPHCRDFYSSAIDYSWVACGRLSATIFRKDTPWDYVPGQFIVSKAGGVIYNEDGCHIAANNSEFLNILKDNASVNHDNNLDN